MNTMPTIGAAITEGVVVPHNGREARNLAEKHRRDKLNASIQELATMVPHVADSARRLDKTAVLRFAAHGLRLQYVFGKSGVKKMRNDDSMYAEPHTTDTLMQLLNSFFITLTCHGQIVLISSSVEQILGHCQSDLYGQNILNITHHEDQALLRQQLIPRDMESLFRNNYDIDRSVGDEEYDEAYDSDELNDVKNTYYHTPNSKTQTNFAKVDQKLRSDKRSFIVRLARASTRSEETRYEFVKIEGCFRRSDFSTSAGTFPIVSQLIRRSRNNGATNCGGPSVLQHDAIAQAALHGISGNDIVLVAIARLIKPPTVSNRLIEGNVLEYRTRHLIDGRIVDCDQRIGLVAGYMKEEVRNLSPFSFIHQDDVRWVIVALRQMYDGVADYGESCYRLISRNGQFIYLQTQGYFEIDKTTNRVHSFVCINTLLDEDVGRRRVQEMKRKFSIFIQTKMPSNSVEDVPASQNPQQLERIVLYLIEDLQKRHELNDKPLSATHERVSYANDRKRAVKTPPIALVAPETDSVRSSITKSVNIINITSAKNLYRNTRSPGSQYSEASLSPASSNGHFEECTESNISPNISTQRPSVLQMNLVPQVSKTNNGIQSSLSPTSSLSSISSLSPIPAAQAQQQVSVLKRLHSSPANQVADSNISPAKRTSASRITQTILLTTRPNLNTTEVSNVKNLDSSIYCNQRLQLNSIVPHSNGQLEDTVTLQPNQTQKVQVNFKSELNAYKNQSTNILSSELSHVLNATTLFNQTKEDP